MARMSVLPLGAAQRALVGGSLRMLGRLTDESSLRLHEQTADQLFEDLGEDWRGMFRSFDDEPVAAASLARWSW